MRRFASRSLSAACILAAAILAGCHARPRPASIAAPSEPENAVALDQATDPCAMRMQDIIGQLLTYYALHSQMPARLDDLKPLADPGMDTTYTCPDSKLPYIYVPGGIVADGLRDRLVLYDPTPVHHGLRWAVTMKPPVAGQIQMFVIPMNETLFNAYTGGK